MPGRKLNNRPLAKTTAKLDGRGDIQPLFPPVSLSSCKFRKSSNKAAVFLPITVAVFNVFILLFPREMTEAARGGVSLWFNGVLPALLPFVVGASLLMGLGAVHFLGVLLNPLMRPLFGVPGSGAFAFLVGVMSGNPVGAKITCGLRESGAVSRAEGQRLLAFASNCGPLFILGSVAAVMLGNMAAGWFIMAAHVAGAVFTGLLFRGYKSKDDGAKVIRGSNKGNILRNAYMAMIEARRMDNRPFGQVLAESVMNAMQTLLLIGGFIVVFSVISAALGLLGVFSGLAGLITEVVPLSPLLIEGVLAGVLEMAGGASAITAAGGGRAVLLALVGVVSWGGLSIHAQAAGYISKTDMSVGIYLLSKMVHTVVAVLIGFALYPVFRSAIEAAAPVTAGAFGTNAVQTLGQSAVFFGYTMLFIAAAVIVVAVVSTARRKRRNSKMR